MGTRKNKKFKTGKQVVKEMTYLTQRMESLHARSIRYCHRVKDLAKEVAQLSRELSRMGETGIYLREIDKITAKIKTINENNKCK